LTLWGGPDIFVHADSVYDCDSLANPAHDGHGEAVAKTPVAWPVSGWLAAIGNVRPVVGKSLKSLSLYGGYATDGARGREYGGYGALLFLKRRYERDTSARAVLACVEAFGAECVRYAAGDIGFGCWVIATASKARCNAEGKILPRFFARRNIPEQAFAVKKYRCGTSPIRMSDNEHAAAALRDSEVASVQNTVGEPKPAFPHGPEEGSESAPPIGGKHTGDILPNEPARSNCLKNSYIFESELSSIASKAGAKSRHRKILARGAPDKNVN
jgi:hypothetical protein